MNFKGKEILVTGGTGFIGSVLVKRLSDLGAYVTPVSRSSKLGFDISEAANMMKIDRKFDIIFHLAAMLSGNNPETEKLVWKVNVNGTRNILELAERSCVSRFVYCSSSMVYSWNAQPINENFETAPPNFYGRTKLKGEKLCIESGIDYVIPRFFNVCGPGQKNDVVTLFCEKALRNECITIHGKGSQKRDFINVSDVVDALIIAGVHENASRQIINFGTGVATSLNELAELVVKITRSSSSIAYVAEREHDGDSVCDNSKARRTLGWEPKIALKDSIKEIVQAIYDE